MKNSRLDRLEKEAVESAPFLASDEKSSTLKDPEPLNKSTAQQTRVVKPWVHFVAGGVGGMAGAVCTSPFDVVKTRLQSDVYSASYRKAMQSNNIFLQGAQHFKETFGIIRSVRRTEGFTALFKGLGPNLAGVIPARSINFFTYGVCKDTLSRNFNNSQEATWIHLMAAITAGIATSTATNPIWMIKTRLQLDKATSKQYKNSIDCLKTIVKKEGFFALYKGLFASYLGSVESTLQWMLYEQMKFIIHQKSEQRKREGHKVTTLDTILEWGARSGSAGFAKFVASLITYPHEVIRTRLRQAPTEGGKPKYTGVIQCFKLVMKEEGLVSMYGGLTPHLLRTVPNSIIMFGTWELVINLLS
ncbi:hypothetical protein WICPIJ_005720 [Wickerhamomyces pijperi]|uniref:Mitochondrial carrier protein RIM2 n=1 Tax=Wickerhamomyces pijperi TaxID=599730 RepID=A0A9P8Q5L7_WICPI|nr:hypothetical protein WICPIJ_005720 [Wickerhamomyces pijperi]